MPASLVVQVLLWPEKLTDWAREEGVTPALVYNMLGGFKPYHDLRHRLAERLGVGKGALDHLIDGRRPQPSARRLPDPPADFAPTPPPPADGLSPLETERTEGSAPRQSDTAADEAPERGIQGANDTPDPQIGLGF
jgi:hypothetical protein